MNKLEISKGNKSHKNEDYGEQKRKYNLSRSQYKIAFDLLGRISIKPNSKFLDVGCGLGEFADILSKKGFVVTCVDGYEKNIQSVKKRGYNCSQVDLEYQNLPYDDNQFDVIVSLDVIEHLWNTDFYLSEIKRVLKDTGYVILTTLNYNYIYYRFKHLIGNFDKYTYKSRHKKFYTYRSFKKEVMQYFQIEGILGNTPAKYRIISLNKFPNLFTLGIGIIASQLK